MFLVAPLDEFDACHIQNAFHGLEDQDSSPSSKRGFFGPHAGKLEGHNVVLPPEILVGYSIACNNCRDQSQRKQPTVTRMVRECHDFTMEKRMPKLDMVEN